MPVPPYEDFIQPILRLLAASEGAVSPEEAREGAARALALSEDDLAARHKSGAVIYRSRAGWAFDRLKRAGLASTTPAGAWEATIKGRSLLASGRGLAPEQIRQIAATKGPSAKGANSTRPGTSPVITGSGGDSVGRGDRKAYRLPARPAFEGGQATLYEATRKSDGKIFILKRANGSSHPKRMKREIEVQSSMSHRNIMPIVDWDRTHFRWYVMPRGVQSMRDLPTPVESLLLLRIVTQLLDGLEHAHGAGHPHRDVNPANIIEVEDGGDRRWVLADWGLTRRELGKTTSALTKTGVLLGTEGFAPPEAYIDGHSVGEPGDLFSLGQVIAWGLGVMPNPYVRTEVEGPWRDLVYVMTQPALADRVQSVAEAREGLRKVAAQLGVVL